jgi:hypothetical protein
LNQHNSIPGSIYTGIPLKHQAGLWLLPDETFAKRPFLFKINEKVDDCFFGWFLKARHIRGLYG